MYMDIVPQLCRDLPGVWQGTAPRGSILASLLLEQWDQNAETEQVDKYFFRPSL